MYKAQAATRQTANKKLKAERHQKRMAAQNQNCWLQAHGQKTKRGAARKLRRAASALIAE